MNPPPAGHRWRGPATLSAAVAIVGLATVVACRSATTTHPARSPLPASSPAPFSWLTPTPAPASWRQLALPAGTAVLSYPPSMRPVAADPGAVSAALVDPTGHYLTYLNATPQQGAEKLAGWAAFRIGLLRDDTASTAHADLSAEHLTFRDGHGSCVIDHYTTRIKANQYREIACFVVGQHGASVLVAATASDRWNQDQPLLEQAVNAYLAR
jgi:hypothetical protein